MSHDSSSTPIDGLDASIASPDPGSDFSALVRRVEATESAIARGELFNGALRDFVAAAIVSRPVAPPVPPPPPIVPPEVYELWAWTAEVDRALRNLAEAIGLPRYIS